MGSILDVQRAIILDTIARTAPGEWKVMVMDEASRKLVDNAVKEDDILNANITNIEMIEQRRPLMPDMDAVYFLMPKPHVVDCLVADFEQRRYRKAYLLWTSKLDPQLRERVDRSRNRIARLQVLNVDYYPRESHLVTFRDPWSFPILYHPSCNNLIRRHLSDLAEKITAICVSLGEYPNIRYYRPRNPLPSHEAHVLASLLARQVQDELDMWAQYHQDFPPPSPRPRGVLYIVDRSMDIMAPFLHEFTYEAMAFDLLPIKDGDKITYKTILNEGQPDQEEKDVEISENDKIWVENRHRHMKDTIEKLMGDFQKFIADNPHFTKQGNASSLNAIKDMMAGLPEFQQMKEAYSLHLSMAQESMNIFQQRKLPDLASIEQLLATGLDEDYKKPKNVADQVVRTLDEEAVTSADRLRLLALYLLFKDGLLPADLSRLCAHAQLSPNDEDVLRNLELLGARVAKALKDKTPPPEPVFPRQTTPKPGSNQDEYALSRYETNLKQMLDAHVSNTLDPQIFPYTKPDMSTDANGDSSVAASSLRSAKPTWARARGGAALESRQRVIVFVAGGATYSEARACYEVGERSGKEIFLVSSHMLTPGLWMRQLSDLSADRRRLGIPSEGPKPKTPGWVFEEEKPLPPAGNGYSAAPSPTQQAAQGSTAAAQAQARRAGMIGGGGLPARPSQGTGGGMSSRPPPAPAPVPASEMAKMNLGGAQNGNYANSNSAGKPYKEKEKKKHKLFGSKK